MTASEIAALLDEHVCHSWPRRDSETKTTLFTMRCRTCGEVCASPDPIAGLRASNEHCAQMLVDAGLA